MPDLFQIVYLDIPHKENKFNMLNWIRILKISFHSIHLQREVK